VQPVDRWGQLAAGADADELEVLALDVVDDEPLEFDDLSELEEPDSDPDDDDSLLAGLAVVDELFEDSRLSLR